MTTSAGIEIRAGKNALLLISKTQPASYRTKKKAHRRLFLKAITTLPVFSKGLRRDISPSPRATDHGRLVGVFNRLGRKAPATSAVWKAKIVKGGHWKVQNQEGLGRDLKTITPASRHVRKKLFTLRFGGDTSPSSKDMEKSTKTHGKYMAEVMDVEGAPECMRISGFMHGITQPGLIKHLYERIPRSMDEMYRMTTSFLQGKVAAFSTARGGRKKKGKKASLMDNNQKAGTNRILRKSSKTKQDQIVKPDRFSLLYNTPKEIFALEKGKFKSIHPQIGTCGERGSNKNCEFPLRIRGQQHGYFQNTRSLYYQTSNDAVENVIEERIQGWKICSQIIRELKQNDKPKAPKKWEASRKDKPLAILMIQP
ncbi:hypothetical protein Tco_1247051 [Tanacetum coccineum]